eukprot:m.199403 g.199403  ORF g.199403 m.199403 type:complete len:58 (+) comp32732_c1_seq2:2421-2594(+)
MEVDTETETETESKIEAKPEIYNQHRNRTAFTSSSASYLSPPTTSPIPNVTNYHHTP